MPLYTVTTQDGLLSSDQRDVIASELVRIHTAVTAVPPNFVHSIFLNYAKNHAYVAGRISGVASITGIIRVGRTAEAKTRIVQEIWTMFQEITGVSDADLSVALQEVPPSQAMENGAVMPEIGHE
jgi:phenylpyruvate tautomerase PptA (4-oxalocrotonate tautomerase family)